MRRKSFSESLWEMIFPSPRICPLCEKKQSELMICEECREKLASFYAEHLRCARCGTFGTNEEHCLNHQNWPPYLKNNKSLWPYEKEYRQVLLSFKFRAQPWLAQMLGSMLADLADKSGEIVIPVPISKERLAERGFNQSALLAKEIAKNLNLPYADNVLVKIKNTPNQSTLSREERRNNLNDALSIKHPEKIKGKKIILVDDICTTGATLAACAQILHEYSGEDIFALTVCNGVDSGH